MRHTSTEPLTVLYNSRCPICRAEIDHYAAYAEARGLPVRFEAITDADLASWDLTAEDAARRLHVRQGSRIISGIPAFRLLWAAMPRYRVLAWITGLPGLRGASDWAYDRVLAPWLYRSHLKRQAAAGLNRS